MGVDITHIIRHKFENIKYHDATLRYAKDTIESLKKKLCLNAPEEYFEFMDDDEGIKFRHPVYDIEMSLHNGF